MFYAPGQKLGTAQSSLQPSPLLQPESLNLTFHIYWVKWMARHLMRKFLLHREQGSELLLPSRTTPFPLSYIPSSLLSASWRTYLPLLAARGPSSKEGVEIPSGKGLTHSLVVRALFNNIRKMQVQPLPLVKGARAWAQDRAGSKTLVLITLLLIHMVPVHTQSCVPDRLMCCLLLMLNVIIYAPLCTREREFSPVLCLQ